MFENPFGDNGRGKKLVHMGKTRDKGFFRDPRHVEQERVRKHNAQ